MNWYYADGSRQVGPLTDSDLENLVRAGTVKPETLVWQEGMPEWKPYAQVTGAAPAGASNASDGTVCSQCGRVVAADEVVQFGGSSVCAACKPVFLQKLKEGAAVGSDVRYAGFWIRVAAKVLDGLILMVPMMLVFALMMPLILKEKDNPAVGMVANLIIQLGFWVVSCLYTVFFLGKYGATPGKMVCKLRVITPDGGNISYGRATGRFFGDMLSGLICYIGYLMVAFDSEEHRALHDRICNTRVIYK